MSSSPPNERSGNNGLNDNHNDQRTLHNSDSLPTSDSSSNNPQYSTSVSNDDLSLTHSLRDAGLGSATSRTAETAGDSASYRNQNPADSIPVVSHYVDPASSSQPSGTTAASRSPATDMAPSNPEAVASHVANPIGPPSMNNPTNPGGARNGGSNFMFTYRDGRLVRIPTRPMGPSDEPIPSPSEADGNDDDPREQEEVTRLVSSVLSGLGLPISWQAPAASIPPGPQAAATPQTNPQHPPGLNSIPMNTLDDPIMAPSDTPRPQGSNDQPSTPTPMPNGGVLVSLSFDVERRSIIRDRNGFPYFPPSQPQIPSPSTSPSTSTPLSSGSERQGTDREANLEAFRRSMADARANGRDINWREAIRTSRESSRAPSAPQSAGSSEPSVRSVPEPTIPSSTASNAPSLANLLNSVPSGHVNSSPNPPPGLPGGLPHSFLGPFPGPPPNVGGPGGMGGISGFWVPGDAAGPFPIPFFAPFFGPGAADFLSGEKPPDKRRARELLRGLKVAPKGLIKRLEEVERVRSMQPSKIKPAEGAEKSAVEGASDGQGKLLCAVCWDPLLPADDPTEDGDEDDHIGHGHEEMKPAMEIDENEIVDGDADDEMDIDEEETEVTTAEPNTANTKPKSTKPRRPPPWANQLIVLPCTHVFHAECLEPWFTTSKTTCPTCRFDVDPESLTLDLGRLFGNARRSRNNATPANGAGRTSGAPAATATTATGAGEGAAGNPIAPNPGDAGDRNNADGRGSNGTPALGLLGSILASAMARAVAGAIYEDGPESPQQATNPGARENDNNQPRSDQPSINSGFRGPIPSDRSGNIPRGTANGEPTIGIPLVVVEDGAPDDLVPEDDDAEVMGSVNQILSSLFGAAAMAGPQPSPSAPQNRPPVPTSSPFNIPQPPPFSVPQANPTSSATGTSSPASGTFSNPPGSSRPQTPSTRTPSPSWGFGFHRTYTLGPGSVGLGSPGFAPRPMSPAPPMSRGSDSATSVPNPASMHTASPGSSAFSSTQNSPSFSQTGRVPSGTFPEMATPSGTFPGTSSSRFGAGPRPSTPTSSRHHPYAHARPHTPNVSSPSTGAEASNDSSTPHSSQPNSAGGNRPEFTITHHTITFSWGVPADIPMRDAQGSPDPANPTNDNGNDNSNQNPGPQSPPPPTGFPGPFPLDPQTPFRTIFHSAWTGGPRPGGGGLFGGFSPAPGSGGIGATRTTPGSNSSNNRQRRKWVAPEGSSLRSVVEAREREVGLRCDDVSCLWGPEDDDDPEEKKVVRKERVFLKKNARIIQSCPHRFHPECLLVSTRISEPMIEEEIDEGDDDEPIEVSCPRCRTRGSMKKTEWRHCKQFAESI